MKTLVLDNYDSFTYNLVHILEQYTAELDVFRNDEISIEEVEKYDKILLSPGPSLPIDAGIMMELIDVYHKRKDIFGVCLGMQGIVQYFQGELFNLPSVNHGITETISVDPTSFLFQGLENEIEVGLYHSWGTREELLPDCLEGKATLDEIIMSIEHKSLKISGVQFHPESIMTPSGKQIIENWLKR